MFADDGRKGKAVGTETQGLPKRFHLRQSRPERSIAVGSWYVGYVVLTQFYSLVVPEKFNLVQHENIALNPMSSASQ